MKENVKIKLLLIGLMIVLFSACSFGQSGFETSMYKSKKELRKLEPETFKLDLTITINNKVVKDSSYILVVKNRTSGVTLSMQVKHKFVIYFAFDNEFEVSIQHYNTSIKTIYVSTKAPVENWYVVTGIDLKHNSDSHVIAGGLRYNNKSRTFEKYRL